MLQKLPINGFKWIENAFQYNGDLIKSYNEESGVGYLLKLITNILKSYMIFTMTYPFHLKELKLRKFHLKLRKLEKL